MKSSPPDRLLLLAFAGCQLLALVLAFTVVPWLLARRSTEFTLVVLFVAALTHLGLTFWMLDVADPATERSKEMSVLITLTLIVVVAFPTEPRIAQGLCAAAFVGVLAWQVLLRILDE